MDELKVTSLEREVIDSLLERVQRLETALVSARLVVSTLTAQEVDLTREWVAARDAAPSDDVAPIDKPHSRGNAAP